MVLTIICVIPSLPFTWKLHSHVWCTMSLTHSLPSWFWLKIFVWIHDVVYDHISRASNHTNEWKIALKVTLNLTLSQHSHDEDPKLQEVHPHFEIRPLQTRY
jgi:hypothetical protein